MLNERMIAWLGRRGLDTELAVRMGWESIDTSVLKIPYLLDGKVVNNKYREVKEKKFWQDGDARKIMWNADVISDKTLATPLLITEGELDALAAIQSGFVRAVSVPDGAPSQAVEEGSTKFDYLDLEALEHVDEFILATDGDGPGQVLRNELAIRLGRSKCRFVEYPDGTKDLNDVLRDYGPEKVAQCIHEAPLWPVKGIFTADQLPAIPEAVPYSTGIPGLDDLYRIRLGEFAVWTGFPGGGKTTFANEIACRMVDAYGWNVGFASFEQPPQREHIKKLVQWKLRKPIRDCMDDEIADARKWVNDNFVFLIEEDDEDEPTDLVWLLDRSAIMVRRHNIKLMIVDPWNELEHAKRRDETLTEYTGRAIKHMKRWARKFDVHLAIVAHPSKPNKGRSEESQKPTMYDISDSAHWANKPDIGMTVWREKDMTQIIIRKVRFQPEAGQPGNTWLHYNTYTGRFEAGADPKDVAAG